MLRSLALAIGIVAVGFRQLAAAEPAGHYYYSPRLAMTQPTAAYGGNGNVPRSMYLPSGAYGPNYGYPPGGAATPGASTWSRLPETRSVGFGQPEPPGPYSGLEWAGNCHACDGGMACGWRHGPYDMPQHYPYYPPLHGYYYFYPYHYTHVPSQQALASQFGVDPRNPYSNDFFKVVYAEYRASLLRPTPEPIGTPPTASQAPWESPTDVLKKLKALSEEGVLSQEEFEAKKAELLGRM